MSDSELFMECEEEELEPWQKVDDDVQDEEMTIVEHKEDPASSSIVVAGSASLDAAPPAGVAVALPVPVSSAVIAPSPNPSSDGKQAVVTMLTNTVPPGSSLLTPPLVPPAAPLSVPSLVPAAVPQLAPGQQLILTQSPGPLGPVAMSQVLQPVSVASKVSAGNVTGQPIFITTQGFQVQSPATGQNTVNPVGFLLNGQPVTLLPAAGTQFFNPTVGVPQVLSQQVTGKPATTVTAATRPPPSTFTMQIPATLTIQSSAPLATPGMKPPVTVAATRPPIATVTKIAEKQTVYPESKKLVSAVKAVSPAVGTQPKTLQIVMGNCKAPTNGLSAAPSSLDSTKVDSLPANKVCPRCGAQFRVVQSLRGHMCFCCPELTQSLQAMNVSSAASTRPTMPKPLLATPATSSLATSKTVTPKMVAPNLVTSKMWTPAAKTAVARTKSPSPSPSQPEEGTSSSEMDTHGKLIMLVDDFYYGHAEGLGTRGTWESGQQGAVQFRCLSCDKKLKNNIRMMNHMKHHIDLEQQSGEVDTHTTCQHCYRQFPTPFRLQCHLESVHSQYESTTKCKICEWAFESEPLFLQHMKNTHKPGEMPYVCQVCEYRSSFYSDVFRHFYTWHKDSANLLCPYCLKVFKTSSSYQQHYLRHQKKSVYHCDKCRLQFLFTKDKIEHKLQHHKTFRKPHQLEGLKPGTKVTIRAYAVQNKPVGILQTSRPGVMAVKAEPIPQTGIAPATPTSNERKQLPAKRKPVCSMQELLTKFQEERAKLGKQNCLECNFEIPDFSNHYPTYVTCSLCHYRTCCSRAYANHMINNHVSRKTSTKYLALYKAGPRWSRLTCTTCGYVTQVGDQMAKHLVNNPSHSSSHCTLKGPPTKVFPQISQSPAQKQGNVNNGSSSSSKVKAPAVVIPIQNLPVSIQILPLPVPVSAQAPGLEQDMTPVEARDVGTKKDGRIRDGTGSGKDVLTLRQLRIVLFALCCGVAQAAEHFDTDQHLIWTWILEKERALEQAGGGADEGEVADRLAEWVLTQREQQLPVNESSLFRKASELQRQSGSSGLSYEWAVDFLLRRKLGLQSMGVASCGLYGEAKDSVRAFTELVRQHVQAGNAPLSAVGTMDEVSVFVDPSLLPYKEAFQLVGTEQPLCDVVLSALADGTLLPVMVFFRGHLPENVGAGLPDSVLLEARAEGFTEAERLELWTTRVWQKGVATQGGSKTLLVLDTFRGHTLDTFLEGLQGSDTLPAMVPVSCSCRLHPLEMCVGPVLRGFLEARWSQLVAEGEAAEVTPKDVVQKVLAWLVEALVHLHRRPELIQRSFRAASVIPPEEGDESPAETQRELVRSLTEVLMGPKPLSPTPLKKNGQVKSGEPDDDGPSEVREKENVLDTSAESVATSPRSMGLAPNPQALRQVFEKDSDVESFYGFEESEIRRVLDA